MIRLLTDINFSGPVVRGLFLRRPTIDLVRGQDVGLDGVPDPDVLAWAAADDRILLSHDIRTLPDPARDRVRAGLPMPGVFLFAESEPVRVMLDELLLLDECSEHVEWAGQVVWLPV